ncbi:MAG: BatD family protein, partial [Planctomycetales bacterium]|nr:BatD family protein [Planctomycetales bacterium]
VSRDPFASLMRDMPFRGVFDDDTFGSPFGRRLTVQSVRPIVADATVEPIDVLPIPTAGRPADYRGAVGQYQVVAQANTTTVKAGDPIELLIGVVGTGPMELVQAPPLAELPALTADFKVPNEPLAGFVQGDQKVFSTKIRPRKEGVSQIPPIPFTYFDPQQDKFVTTHSKPIAIHVEPADTLALDAIVGGHAVTSGQKHAKAADAAFANYTGDGLLRNEAPYRLDPAWLAWWLVLPPLAVFIAWAVRNRHQVSRHVALRGFGLRRVQDRIAQGETAAEVVRTLKAYLAKRLGVKGNSTDGRAVVGALRAAGQHKIAVRCERLFNAAESAGMGQAASLDELKREALEVLTEVHHYWQSKCAKPKRQSNTRRAVAHATRIPSRTASLALLACAILLSGSAASAGDATWIALNPDQKTAVLADASALYDRALQASGADSAEAKQAFQQAADKYQLLVDSGVTNSRLCVNLANAYLQSGQPGRAIVSYRRALRIDPTNHTARSNLSVAVQSLGESSSSQQAAMTESGVLGLTSAVKSQLSHAVRPRTLVVLGVCCWIVAWLAVGLRLFTTRFPWKTLAATSLLIAAASTGLYSLSVADNSDRDAIVQTSAITLREGDGDRFPAVSGAELHEGQTVTLVKQRGDWLKVRSESGQTGWLPCQTVEVI